MTETASCTNAITGQGVVQDHTTPQLEGTRNRERSCTGRRAAWCSDGDLSGYCTRGYGRSHLGVGIHSKAGCLHTAEGHFGGLLETDARDSHRSSHRTARGGETRDLWNDAEYFVALQRAA